MSNRVIDFFGMRYEVPLVSDLRGTIIAINVGGAVIPTLMSIYLWHYPSDLAGRS
jgi:uncharacterized membrane protein